MINLNKNGKWFVKIFILLVCIAMLGTARADWPQTDKLLASDGATDDTFGNGVSIYGDYAIVGATYDNDNGHRSGSAYIFTPNDVDPNNWDEVTKLTASDGAAEDLFGWSVSISGGYAIVGAIYDNDNGSRSGSAYIFTPNDVDPNNWDEVTKLTASDGAAEDLFGCSVSISEDYFVIGAYHDDDNGTDSGSVYIFAPNSLNPNNWDEVAKLTASDGATGDFFGYSVSISGDYVIVGACDNDDKGSAYIFTPNDVDPNNWEQVAKLTALDGTSGDAFGRSVSINGDYAVVGADLDDDLGSMSGSAYIFKREGESWTQQDKLLASDGDSIDRFGWCVSISGDYAIVGAHWHDSQFGSAYAFKRSVSGWFEVDKLTASDAQNAAKFGHSVSISGERAIVGALSDNNVNGTDAGAAYMFKRVCPSGLIADLSGDCFVNFVDFSVFANQWPQNNYDLNGDSFVNLVDLSIFAGQWLQGN